METEPRTWIDGVPVFWTETGRPQLTASLRFRQGVVDETPQTTGWTHLVEHLALHDRDHGGLRVNGSTGLLETSLDLQGSPDAVLTALDSITSWLAHPELSRLPQEAMVLRAEARTRNITGLSEALLRRYGAAGPGLHSLGELGLYNATLQPIGGWIQQRFTAGNAVLVLDGPPPPELTLRLPGGPRRPTPPAVPLPIRCPAGYPGGAAEIIGSGLLPRSTAALVMAEIGERLLSEELRERAAGAYAPGSFVQPVDNRSAVVGFYSDLSPELAETIFERWLVVLGRLRTGNYAATMITNWAESARQAARDPYAAFQNTLGHASRQLCGRPPQSDEQWLHELSVLDQAAVGRLTDQWLESQLLAVPPGVSRPPQLSMLEPPRWPADAGRTYRSRPYNPAARIKNVELMTIGAHSVQVGTGEARPGARFADLVGVLRYPDGGRLLIDRWGWWTRIEPTLWVRGSRAVREIDDRIPADLWIAAPQRSEQAIPIAPRMSNAARWVDVIIGLVVAAGFAALGATSSAVLGIVIGLIMVAIVIGSATYWDRLPSLRR